MQLPEHRLFRRFAGVHAALRELPAPFADTTAEQQLALVVGEDDADVGAESLCVNTIVAHPY